ncbi:alpha/beta fold hydrolase [Deinococcus maricopensis]|uniref:Alpha/beta hydrolase fold protein n=1 Tax=Deinococcus maricopensis (strain DSM 21211 / LMG 22137 / NRRL B-23946 / LB-34) TaxID=709986 RepID=E8U8Y2_DEIML|nr:alpha/beta fold hydrolase [Deinococcus maricopensis]ADV67521.1 alpha/beta hydrolase fold protein [Deinococcus maricopensis DSM 21211]
MHERHEYRDGTYRLTYTVDGSGPPMLLIHGLSGSRRWWRRNLHALQAHYTVYVVDLVGFGSARRQRPLGVRESADLIARWMGSLNLTPAAVVGHSMGGHISAHLAARHPDRVAALVLVCASGLLRGDWWRVALHLPRAALAGKADFLPTIMFDAARAGLVTLVRATRSLLADDITDFLARIQVPTLVVWGARDALVPLPLGKALSEGIQGAQFVVFPRAGHVAMVDAAADFNREVLTFLAAQVPAA